MCLYLPSRNRVHPLDICRLQLLRWIPATKLVTKWQSFDRFKTRKVSLYYLSRSWLFYYYLITCDATSSSESGYYISKSHGHFQPSNRDYTADRQRTSFRTVLIITLVDSSRRMPRTKTPLVLKRFDLFVHSSTASLKLKFYPRWSS